MMMQMLSAGGLSCLTDGCREADENNLKGYFEYEKTKHLREDHSWLLEAQGKAVKVIAQLLPFLPDILELHYRVIFMERDLDEIILSQRAMLARMGKDSSATIDKLATDAFRRRLQQTYELLRTRRIPVLTVEYRKAIAKPYEAAHLVANFCGEDLNVTKMATAVIPSLYREKSRNGDAPGRNG